jgi:MFS family permease
VIAQITALQALRTKDFALLWFAQLISAFGDKVTLYALAFVTWELTHSALSTVVSVMLVTVPFALFGHFGGAIADAVGHRRAMITCDLIRMLAIGSVPTAFAFGASLAVPYALVLISALCSTVFLPARMGLVPDLVPRSELAASNAMVWASDRSVEIIGSLVAGIAVAVFGRGAFYIDALTFALSAVLLIQISRPSPRPRPLRWLGVVREAADGVRFLASNAILRANTIFSLLAQLSIPVFNGLMPVLVFRDYGLGPDQLGVLQAALAAGAVTAALTLPTLIRRAPKGILVIAGFASYGVVLIAIGAAPNFETTVGLFLLSGVANVLFYIPNVTIAQETAPTELRARVFGSRTALLHLTWLPIVLLTGRIAEGESAKGLIGVAGGFTVFVALVGSFFRPVREVE